LAGLVAVSALAAALCVWYYFERNPNHRPGFPIGNPGTLAAALVPAILVALATLCSAAWRWGRTRGSPNWRLLIGSTAALVPLLWCFVLTDARSAQLGLAVGITAMVFLQAGRRARWLAAGIFLAGLVAVGAWFMTHSRFDAFMARGATIRFRLYAWRYAAELWNYDWRTSIAGHGAAAYPRLAGQLSVNDRQLDPAAFMGELVEDAHNELFEVLTEIGLVGGVTFVAGWLATLAAGAMVTNQAARSDRGPLYAALVAAIAGLMADALVEPGLRLPGVPAIFYTLLGTAWALGRAGSRPRAEDAIAALAGPLARSARLRAVRHSVAAGVVGILAVAAVWVTFRDWSGVLHEAAAQSARARGDNAGAVREYASAEARLFDPVHRLICQGQEMNARLAAAQAARVAFYARLSATNGPDSQPATNAAANAELNQLWGLAAEECEAAYTAAAKLGERAPTLMYTAAVQATAAEMLADLYDRRNSPLAEQWWQRAGQKWMEQRGWRPNDVETLLALVTDQEHDPLPIGKRIRFLCDALRSPTGYSRLGISLSFDEVRRRWNGAFRQVAAEIGFAEKLSEFLAAIGPAAPETDLNSLITSEAPEVYRLAAHFEALRGNFAAAADYAARAARLYEPMQTRFPMLQSVALLEQAEFTLRESPERAAAAVDLLRTAIQRLPVIQQQKYDEMALPFRLCLATALLAAGDESGAADVLRPLVGEPAHLPAVIAEAYVELVNMFVRRPADRRPPVENWLAAALHQQPDDVGAWSWLAWLAAQSGDVEAVQRSLGDAARAGVPTASLLRIRRSLGEEFPALRERIMPGAKD
jgi:hypothetical protein